MVKNRSLLEAEELLLRALVSETGSQRSQEIAKELVLIYAQAPKSEAKEKLLKAFSYCTDIQSSQILAEELISVYAQEPKPEKLKSFQRFLRLVDGFKEKGRDPKSLSVMLSQLCRKDKLDLQFQEWFLKKAVELWPENPNANSQLADILIADGRYKAAESYLKKATEFHPKNVILLNKYGWALSNSEKDDEAVAKLGEARQIDPRDTHNYYYLGKHYLRRGKANEAEIEFKKGLDIDPTNDHLIVSYANLLLDKERYDDAAQLLCPAIKDNPKNPYLDSCWKRLQSLQEI